MSSTSGLKPIAPVPTVADFLDIVLSKTQRKTPTVIHKNFKISRIRNFYMRKVRFTPVPVVVDERAVQQEPLQARAGPTTDGTAPDRASRERLRAAAQVRGLVVPVQAAQTRRARPHGDGNEAAEGPPGVPQAGTATPIAAALDRPQHAHANNLLIAGGAISRGGGDVVGLDPARLRLQQFAISVLTLVYLHLLYC
ncbi:hypothetical protein APHAL10511_003819 [Amanita phalloides]|nr:hypothetical protein APHAL10511_003819 [Amanita phalloides]